MKRVLRRLVADLAWAVAIAAVALALLGSTKLRPRAPDQPEIDAAALARANAIARDRVRETLAVDVHWLGKGASTDDLRQQRASLDFVLGERADLRLDPDLVDRLVALEARTANGEAGRVSVDALADTITRISIDRVRTLTDDEIRSAADGFANVHATGPSMALAPELVRDLAAGKQVDAEQLRYVPDAAAPDGVMLRFDGQGMMTAERFVQKAQEIRARLGSTREAALVAQMAPRYVREALDERLDLMSEAFPDAQAEGLTPVQAFLLAYSLASDDRLDVPTLDLKLAVRAEMAAVADSALKGVSRETAYGRGGAYFSTPLEMAFDRPRVAAFLDRIEQEVRR
jgi:hypothetical protein